MQKAITFILLLCAGLSYGQKRPVDHSVYDKWESVGAKQLSNNGQWVMYAIMQQEGDANLNFVNLLNNSKINISRASTAQFSNDSKFAAFSIKPWYAATRLAKIKKKKPDEMTKDTLGIADLTTASVTKIPRVKSFKFPQEGPSFLAYQLEKPLDTSKKAKPEVTEIQKNDSEEDYFADDDPAAGAAKVEGTDLIVKNLATNAEKVFRYVTDYSFSKNGKQLIFACSGSKKDKSAPMGVFVYNTETGNVKTLVKQKGNYKTFVFDESGDYLAFLGEQSPDKQEIKDFKIFYNSIALDTAQALIENDIAGMPQKWAVSGESRLSFSKDGKKLFFGIAPLRKPKDTTIVDFEVAKVDIWSYKDDYLQSQQLKTSDRDSKRTYLTAFDLYSTDPKIIPLTDLKLPDATIVAEGNAPFVLASTDFGNRIQSQWTGNSIRDYYLVDVKTGARKKIIEKLDGGSASISPDGNYVMIFESKTAQLSSYNVLTGEVTILNKNFPVKLTNETNDVPDEPGLYGIGGWTEGDKAVFIYDRYDIWQFSPDGKSEPKNITNGFGRTNGLTFRFERTDPEARFINPKSTVWLGTFNNKTKEDGFYRKNLADKKNPELVVSSANKYSNLVKAKYAERYVYDKGNYTTSPDVYVSSDMKAETKLSATNPQQKGYNWGTSELVKWNTPKGYSSEGILYKPENFDPAKKYPMLVYFYEKVSEGLNTYIAPAPTPSRLNIPYFVSNGYLVFTPDISYETGYPGKSAEEFINSGVEYLKKNSWVDGSKIGIQGQSWGGYQVAHLITRTNMYAAAWAGAPVVNMTSAYGGIRWESGNNRQSQYEKGQSRIGATLWEKPELYIENSPLFSLPKVNTPLAIMSNDADGAVPWYQGIEFFTAMRRLGKTVWLLNYNNEAHNLVQRQNKKDIQIREQQFFDHYLKGAKAPAWMTSGIPATEKGRSWGFELTDDKP